MQKLGNHLSNPHIYRYKVNPKPENVADNWCKIHLIAPKKKVSHDKPRHIMHSIREHYSFLSPSLGSQKLTFLQLQLRHRVTLMKAMSMKTLNNILLLDNAQPSQEFGYQLSQLTQTSFCEN